MQLVRWGRPAYRSDSLAKAHNRLHSEPRAARF